MFTLLRKPGGDGQYYELVFPDYGESKRIWLNPKRAAQYILWQLMSGIPGVPLGERANVWTAAQKCIDLWSKASCIHADDFAATNGTFGQALALDAEAGSIRSEMILKYPSLTGYFDSLYKFWHI